MSAYVIKAVSSTVEFRVGTFDHVIPLILSTSHVYFLYICISIHTHTHTLSNNAKMLQNEQLRDVYTYL